MGQCVGEKQKFMAQWLSLTGPGQGLGTRWLLLWVTAIRQLRRSGEGGGWEAALQLLSSSEGGVVPAEGVLLASTDTFNEDPLVNSGGFLPCEMPAQQFSAPI